jgi:AraC family transcriptional regulator
MAPTYDFGTMRNADLLHVLKHMGRHYDAGFALGELARRTGWSPFHLHREFRRRTGETPRNYAERVRLEIAAAKLLASDEPVSQLAFGLGFSNHEVFTRAFRRRFGRSPSHYREVSRRHPWHDPRKQRVALTRAIAPCVRLFRMSLDTDSRKTTMPTLSIVRQDRPEQPVLFIQRRVARSELQPMLGECFGKLFGHGHQAGLPIAGWPIARYLSTGPGLWVVQAVLPLVTPVPGEGEMEAGFLPGGPVALAVHAGPYEQLPETYAALERWIDANGFKVAGAPWESYVTDPGEHPNPADWKTEIFWPLSP